MLQARLSHVAFRAADVDATRRFYEDNVGLSSLPGDVTRLSLGLGEHVLQLSEGRGLDHFALEVADDVEFDALLDRLTAHGVRTERVQDDGAHPSCFRFTDPGDHVVEVHKRTGVQGEDVGDPGRRPIRLHHITLNAPDIPALGRFYTEVLGFKVSDRMGTDFMWLRCNREHHTVALTKGPQGGLDHFCFEVNDWNDLKTWCDEMPIRNVPITWGPGRHGPGNNLFIFFDDPDAVRIELTCEVERFWDDHVEYPGERVWSDSSGALNLWGPTPQWREAFKKRAA